MAPNVANQGVGLGEECSVGAGSARRCSGVLQCGSIVAGGSDVCLEVAELGGSCDLAGFKPCGGGSDGGASVCEGGVCVAPGATVGLGEECAVGKGGASTCRAGLLCGKVEEAGPDVCLELVDLGGTCDPSGSRHCNSEQDSRAVCEGGVCMASNIVLFGDRCGDSPDGVPTGVVCGDADDCEAGELSCIRSTALAQTFCGFVNQQPGEWCDTGIGGGRELALCGGAATYFVGPVLAEENRSSGSCILLAGDG